MDAHRASLMNILGPDLTGERVLDLFAGSGAFAIECLSRGAARAVLVEQARPALSVIHRNLGQMPEDERGDVEVVSGDCYAPPPLGGPFDVVFVAPPYPHFRAERERIDALLRTLATSSPPLLAPDAVVVVQSDAGDFENPPAELAVESRRRWGRTEFTLLRVAAS